MQDNNNVQERGEFTDISEIRDIVSSAHMGIWRIELFDGEEPRMFADETMKKLLGIDGQERTPEKTYTDWFVNITPEALPSVLHSVEQMQKGFYDENTYQWMHPTKGVRYVRCGGTSQKVEGGYIIRGYHYDVDEFVRRQQAQAAMLQHAISDKNEYYSVLGTLGGIFYSIHVIDLCADTVIEYTTKNEIRKIVNHTDGAAEMMHEIMTAVSFDDHLEEALAFTDLSTLPERMKNKKLLTKQLVGRNTGWFIAGFIMMEADAEGKPTKVIFTTRVNDAEKKQQEQLLHKSQTDELTGLYNRRAYEEDIYAHNDKPEEDDFIYISIDVNGLKVINDTKGHMAGDELITGACQCMKKIFGPHGRIYRVGGDEFVAILVKDVYPVKDILAAFDEEISGWKGSLIDSLSVAYGWVSKEESPESSVRQLGAIAEERMYAAKTAHYRKQGVDRRGQQDAHKALCRLYTKILKINITDDTCQVINMDVGEMTPEKGFSEKISEWLTAFGTTGQVHPVDLAEYLRVTNLEYMKNYFADGKTSLHIFHRRKYDDSYKQVMMEIILAEDYSEDNQSLFLYVKDIDR
ncbi:MAG: GGDEF domain-containing protein [Selenomonadaceae bacterium]|nr:GGDEF domain-containing protein [Selenomonadaceae bacterium]